MAEVTGPISSLPGAHHDVPDGTMCDLHPDRPAVARVQGETDSMGCELNDMCQECLDEHRRQVASADTSGICDWCKNFASKLRDHRDYEEGMCGRVYQVCDDCVKKENDRLKAEMAYDDDLDEGPFDDADDGLDDEEADDGD